VGACPGARSSCIPSIWRARPTPARRGTARGARAPLRLRNGASVGASCETTLDWCMAAVCAHRLAATIPGGVRGQPRGAAGLPIRVGAACARRVSAGRRGLAAGGAGMPATHDSDGATDPQRDQGEERPGSDAGVAPVHSAGRGRGLRDLDDGHVRGAEGAAPGGGVAGVGGAQVRRRLTYAGGVTGVGERRSCCWAAAVGAVSAASARPMAAERVRRWWLIVTPSGRDRPVRSVAGQRAPRR
jgi:hypothetical protein